MPTVRDTSILSDDPKNSHLGAFAGAMERLTLHRADLLDYGSLRNAFAGCHGVFHVASPVTNDPVAACMHAGHVAQLIYICNWSKHLQSS